MDSAERPSPDEKTARPPPAISNSEAIAEEGSSSTATDGGTAASPSNAPRRPPQSMPFISLYRPPPGHPPNTTDERCLIYCSQSALHRSQHKPPTCRSICLRRVFPFEVEVRSSSLPNSSSSTALQQEIPLPPEGQPKPDPSLDLGPVSASTSYTGQHSPSLSSSSSIPSRTQPQIHHQPKETRIWNPGFYIWTSTSARAARDRIETMSLDLGQEHTWVRKREEWIRKRQAALMQHGRGLVGWPAVGGNGKDGRITLDDGIQVTRSGHVEGPWSHSLLFPLSTTSLSEVYSSFLSPFEALFDPVRALLAPTSHALSHVHRALSNGSLQALGAQSSRECGRKKEKEEKEKEK
ncbi:hypothetical protein ID866_940 [Astraeus odoratus]|nr:hypothetical protein ID866_940 [Astraeus odoratus]